MAQKYSTRIGLVAFFDVLGYQNFILHSDIQKSAAVIEEVILRMPEIVLHFIREKLKQANAEEIMRCFWKPVMFSDSVVWDISFDTSIKGGVGIQWITFISACCLVEQLMFKRGLPVRGAISHGEYYISGSCFAGKPIIEAYDLCNKIDMVGCGLTLQAEMELPRGKIAGIDAFGALLTNYSAPLKGAKPQQLMLLNWAFPGGLLLEPLGEDTRDQIIKAFLSHGKQVSTEVYAKVGNTEDFFIHCKGVKAVWDRENQPPR